MGQSASTAVGELPTCRYELDADTLLYKFPLRGGVGITHSLNPVAIRCGKYLSANAVCETRRVLRLLGPSSAEVAVNAYNAVSNGTVRGDADTLLLMANWLDVDGFTGSVLGRLLSLGILSQSWTGQTGTDYDFYLVNPPSHTVSIPSVPLFHYYADLGKFHVIRLFSLDGTLVEKLRSTQGDVALLTNGFSVVGGGEIPGFEEEQREVERELRASLANGVTSLVWHVEEIIVGWFGELAKMSSDEMDHLQKLREASEREVDVIQPSAGLYVFDASTSPCKDYLRSRHPVVFEGDTLQPRHDATGVNITTHYVDIAGGTETLVAFDKFVRQLLDERFPGVANKQKQRDGLRSNLQLSDENALTIFETLFKHLCVLLEVDGLHGDLISLLCQRCGAFFSTSIFDTFAAPQQPNAPKTTFHTYRNLGAPIAPWPRQQSFALLSSDGVDCYVFTPVQPPTEKLHYVARGGAYRGAATTMDDLAANDAEWTQVIRDFRASLQPNGNTTLQSVDFADMLLRFEEAVDLRVITSDPELLRQRQQTRHDQREVLRVRRERESQERILRAQEMLDSEEAYQRFLNDNVYFRPEEELSVEERMQLVMPIATDANDTDVDQSPYTCPICTEMRAANEVAAIAACGHIACRWCIAAMKGLTCPLCRAPAAPRTIDGARVLSVTSGPAVVHTVQRETAKYAGAGIKHSEEYLWRTGRMLPWDANGLAPNGLCPAERQPFANGKCANGDVPSLRDGVQQPCCTPLEAVPANAVRERAAILKVLLENAPADVIAAVTHLRLRSDDDDEEGDLPTKRFKA